MASNAPGNIGGYDCNFVDEPSADLKCLICLSVAKDPLQHGEEGCGKIYCRSCITEYRKKNNKCPNCRKDIVTFKDVRSERDIQSLIVRCTNVDNDCEWVGELRSLEDHHQTCEFVLLPCPNKCNKPLSNIEAVQQVRKISRKNLQKHLTDECPCRQHTCPHCKETGEYLDITGKHIDNCPKIKIQCTNIQCQQQISREDLQTHLSNDCLYETVSCKYKEFGCKVTPKRKYLDAHEKDDKLHLRITMETVLKLKETNDRLMPHLKMYALNQEQKVAAFTFKVAGFALKKLKNITFYSPPFYTHPGGYKMSINVDANGYDKCKGTHVSVWAYLMRGKYDDQLEFPFQGTIKYELLNQLEDKNHHEKSYTYDTVTVKEWNQRVTVGDRADMAQGIDDFIRHTDLKHNAAKNCCYLKDDCLVFCIYIKVPSYKPWLQCTF